MSDARDSASATLATVRQHLSAAEAALMENTPDDAAATERALAELRHAIFASDRFAAELSHDLRNSFTAITGQAQLLERSNTRGTLTPVRVQKAVDQIKVSVAAANAIVGNLSGS